MFQDVFLLLDSPSESLVPNHPLNPPNADGCGIPLRAVCVTKEIHRSWFSRSEHLINKWTFFRNWTYQLT